MCVSHLHVQLMSQESSGPLSVRSPGRWDRRPRPGVGHSPAWFSQVPAQTHEHTGPGVCTSTETPSFSQLFKTICLSFSLCTFSVRPAVCGGSPCEGHPFLPSFWQRGGSPRSRGRTEGWAR